MLVAYKLLGQSGGARIGSLVDEIGFSWGCPLPGFNAIVRHEAIPRQLIAKMDIGVVASAPQSVVQLNGK